MKRLDRLFVLLMLCAGLTGCGGATSGDAVSDDAATANCPAPGGEPSDLALPAKVPAMFRGDAARTGVLPGDGPPANAPVRWCAPVGNPGGLRLSSSPTVAGGTTYVHASAHLVALDTATGQQRWSVDVGRYGSQSSPAVADGIVYVGSDDASLHALDAATGKPLWRVQTGGSIESSPAVAGGIVYVGSEDGVLYALDAATGQERWRFATGAGIDSSPAVVDDVVYVGSNDRYVGTKATHTCLQSSCEATIYALDAATGKERWRSQAVREIEGSPAVGDGLVFIGDMGGTFHALDATTGGERWHFLAGGDVRGSPTVVNGLVIVGTSNGTVWALGAAGGGVRWFFRPASTILLPNKGQIAFDSSPTVVGGAVYVGAHGFQGVENAQTGALFVLDVATGHERWRALLGDGPIDASPAVADGIAIIYADYGVLYALGGHPVGVGSPGAPPSAATPR